MGICPWSKKRRNMKQKRRTFSTDNEDEITKYLNECIVASSSKFEKIARHIVFAILASAWATVVAIDTPKYKYFLFVVVLIAIIYLAIELCHCFVMERISRKIQNERNSSNFSDVEAIKFFNLISNMSSDMLLIRLMLISTMVLLLIIYYSLTLWQ